MKKFAAALLSLVLAAFVTLFGVAPAQAIGSADCVPVAGVSTAGYIGAPSLSSTAYYLYPTQGSAYTAGPTFTPNDFTGSVVFSTSPNLPSGMTINSSTGAITGTPTQSSSATVYKIQATGTPTNTNNGTVTSYCAANEISIEVWASGGGNNSNQWTNVSLTFASATHTPASDVTALSNGENFPGYTVAFTGVAGGTYDSVNILVGDPQNGHFYTVPGATSNNYSNPSSWSPAGTNCGVTNIIRGGNALTASSGVTCMKMTTTYNGQTQYWVRFELGTATAADISFTVAPGTFVVADRSSADQFASFLLRNDNSTSTNYSARAFQLLNAANVGGVGSSSAVDTLISLPTGIGQPVAGQTVGINATNLALNTNYSVILRSTPQVLEQGTTTATFMNTTVTIPAGLEPGWHSITFSAVRSDGVATEQVAYFKISDSGMLLQTSSEVPAELAMTAAPKGDQWSLGVLLAVLGIGLVAAVYTYRRRVFEMVYVLTGNGSNFDIELVEQPKNARYLPMRKL